MLRTLVVLLLAVPCFAQSPLRADNNPTTVAEIKALELKLCDLLVDGKWDEYASYLADDYVRAQPGGVVETRSEVLASMRSAPNLALAMVPEQMDVRVYGDAAVLTINLMLKTKSEQGEIRTRHSLLTKTFIRRGGRWYLVSLAGSGPIK